jgi:hypothetical protein
MFFQTSKPNLIKLKCSANYPRVTGIPIFFFNKGPGPLQRGDNHKTVKIRWNPSPEKNGPFLTRHGTNHPWGK